MNTTERRTEPPHTGTARALPALWTGLALTVAATLVPLVDAVTADILTGRLHTVYDGEISGPEIDAGRTVVLGYLTVLGVLAAGCWLWALYAARRDTRLLRPAATVLLALGWCVALADALITEYGETVLPPLFGAAGILPCVAGTVAVLRLRRPGSPRERDRDARGMTGNPRT
ncbi:hypothetical protein DEH18_10980 [Streptomyces sp. NHF165]|uniref:hypothetical protein n=1 Tax=Streptomyces sp. NHF165 TaxID=2175864 RepID=UPI00132F39BD|nr:hypothetical protein [Streptomyces sp. NHF165]QHF94284.1 hypothetical protein DEH18_10980 [Streptomyces sp. NHF165]